MVSGLNRIRHPSRIHMTRAEIEIAVANAIDSDSDSGARWWPGSEMAPICTRRWLSFSRRNESNHRTIDSRVLDLAKGLKAHFEPGIPYTPFSEWMRLASLVGRVLSTALSPEGTAFL